MVIVITGPTGVGKTKMSIELAKKLNGQIINADSTQVYKNLDIATAKVKHLEQDNVKHYLIDIKNIEEDYTVYDYQKDCREAIEKLLNRQIMPIIVGGTGLYIKAALYDYQFKENTKTISFENLTNQEIYNQLKKYDPDHNIHINNRKRLEAALSYCLNNNQKFSQKEKTDKLLYDTIFIGLTTSRDILYERINIRVDQMFDEGLLDEARQIYESSIRTKAVMTPIGYKELFNYFDNKQSLEECINLIKQKSRNYAKKQYTWFNNQMNIKWFEVDFENFDNTILEVYNYIKDQL